MFTFLLYSLASGLLFVPHSEQQSSCPSVCTCWTGSDGHGAQTCADLRAVPYVAPNVKHLTLSFANTTAIPTNAFTGLRDMVSIKVSGNIGPISGGAFSDITGTIDSEFIISGIVATVETNAFQNIKTFTNIKLVDVTISTVQKFGFNTISAEIFTMENVLIYTIETYALENVILSNNFRVSGSIIQTLQPCAFGGISGPANGVFLEDTSITTVDEYGFGGISDFLVFRMQDVKISGADERGLQGMTRVNNVDYYGRNNDLPVSFQQPGLYLNDIRQRCLGVFSGMSCVQPSFLRFNFI